MTADRFGARGRDDAAIVLSKRHAGARTLPRARFAAQLLREFDDLRYTRDMHRATVSDIANTCEQEGVSIPVASA